MNPAVNKPAGERSPADYYPTPQPLADAVCLRLREMIGPVGLIVEPSAGEGTFVRAAQAAWGVDPMIVAVEPHPQPGLVEAASEPFIHEQSWEAPLSLPWHWPTLVVGNPPFSLWESHARLAMERLGHFGPDHENPAGRADGPGWLAFLLRADVKSGQRRGRDFWPEMPARYEIPLARRPSFTGDGQTDGRDYSVFVWRAGYRGRCEQLEPLDFTPPVVSAEARALGRARREASKRQRQAKVLAEVSTEQLRAELARRAG